MPVTSLKNIMNIFVESFIMSSLSIINFNINFLNFSSVILIYSPCNISLNIFEKFLCFPIIFFKKSYKFFILSYISNISFSFSSSFILFNLFFSIMILINFFIFSSLYSPISLKTFSISIKHFILDNSFEKRFNS